MLIKLQLTSAQKKLLENLMELSFLEGSNYILPLISIPYLMRVLGVEKFGIVMFAQSVMQFFILFSSYGTGIYATGIIAKKRAHQQEVAVFFTGIMFLRFVFVAIGALVLVILIASIDLFREHRDIMLFSYLLVVSQTAFPIWFFQGMEDMKLLTRLSISGKLIYTILIFLVVREPDHYIYVPLLNGVSGIFIDVVAIYIIYKGTFRLPWRVPALKNLLLYLSESFQFFVSRVSSAIYENGNPVVIGFLWGAMYVGYYAAAKKIFVVAVGLFRPILGALYPYMCSKKDLITFRRLFFISMVVALVAGLSLFVLAGPIIQIFCGTGYEKAAMVLKIFSIALIVLVPSMFLGYPLLTAFEISEYANYSVFVGAISYVMFLVVFHSVMSFYWMPVFFVLSHLVILLIRASGLIKLWRMGKLRAV